MNLGIFSRRAPRQAVDQYGAPGKGKSTAISAVTIVLILGSWWLVTHLELIRPLFLPSPEAVISKFNRIACTEHYFEKLLTAVGARAEVEAECHGFSEHTLHEHILWSLYRVFSSFFLAVVTAVPIGDRDGHEPPRARRLRPADRVLPPDPAARLPAADHHLVRDRRIRQAVPDLPGLFRAHRHQTPAPACAPSPSSRSMPPIPWAEAASRWSGRWC